MVLSLFGLLLVGVHCVDTLDSAIDRGRFTTVPFAAKYRQQQSCDTVRPTLPTQKLETTLGVTTTKNYKRAMNYLSIFIYLTFGL